MKKVWIVLVAVIAVIAVAGGIFWFNFTQSPEYALMQIGKDIEKQGIEGLYTHLTAEG